MEEQKEYNNPFRSQSVKTRVIKLFRPQHRRSYSTQFDHRSKSKTQRTGVIHVTLRPQIQLDKSQYDLHSSPSVLTERSQQNKSSKLSTARTRNFTPSTNVTINRSRQNSIVPLSQNSWYNDNSKENLTNTIDKVSNNAKHDSKIGSAGTTHSIKSWQSINQNLNPGKLSDVKAINERPDWTTFENEHRRPNKKKKNKCSRACIVKLVIAALLLVAVVVTIILAVLLTRPKETKQTLNKTAVLRWNSTGVTVAGVTNQLGNAANKLFGPFGIALDYSNTLYIADSSNNRIQKYLYGASVGTTVAGQLNGTGANTSMYLRGPTDVAIDTNNNVYVADTTNNRVQFWSSGSLSGKTVAGNGSAGNSNNQLTSSYGIYYDSNSDALYVSDTGVNRVMRFMSGASSGTLAAGTGIAGPNNTQLLSPCGVYFDLPSNSLLIANTGMNIIVRWVIGAASWTHVAGDINGSSGSSSTELNSPFDVTLDPMGNVYVADSTNSRIQFFLVGQSNATTIAGITGSFGSNSSQLNLPISIALDSQLNLYVADTYNHRIQKFQRY